MRNTVMDHQGAADHQFIPIVLVKISLVPDSKL